MESNYIMKTSKKILLTSAVALASAALVGCGQSDKSATSETKPAATSTTTHANDKTTNSETAKTDSTQAQLMQNVSYTLGYSIGNNVTAQLKAQGASLNSQELMGGFKQAVAGKEGKFSQAQMEQIMQGFQHKLMAEQQTKQVSAVIDNAKALIDNAHTPTIGPKDAKVAVIEFFDYQCVFCHKVAPEMEKIMDANPNIKYVFKEFPIFGQRWEASQYAAEMGIAAYMLNGPQGYLEYHNAVFSPGIDEGKLTVKDVKDIAKKAGVNVEKADSLIKEKKVTDNIKNDLQLGFDKLDIKGTPAIIIMPLEGATKENTTVISGFSTQQAIQAAIDKAQSTK